MFPARLATAVLLLASGAAAQKYAHLYGRILDTSEGGIAQAAITAINQENGFRRTTQSEPGGAYAIGSLQPGLYKLTIRKEGFHTIERYDLKLATSAVTRADFVLPVGPIEESITVYGDASPLERDDASTGTRVPREEIDRLPLNGRGLLTLLEMSPGTNVTPATRGEAGQFTTAGQRANTNYFTIDGVSANTGVMAGGLPAQSSGGSLPMLSAFGSMDSLISVEAVQEFRVTTSTSMAEMGRMPGAILSLTSRSGTNEFHGSTAYRIRNELTGANDWFGNQAGYGRLPLRLHDFTQTLGGPVKRNRTFFFVSYERMGLRQPNVWRQPVPSVEERLKAAEWAKPLLELFPLPLASAPGSTVGEWTGRMSRPAGLDAGGLRIDQAIGSRVSLFGRYHDTPSRNEFGTLAVNRLDLRAQSLTLGASARLHPNLVFELRANESQAGTHSVWTSDTAGDCALLPVTQLFSTTTPSCDYLMRFSIGGVGQLISGREGDRRQRQFQIVPSGLLGLRGQTLKFGVDFRRILAIRRDPAGTLGVIADSMESLEGTRFFWTKSSAPQNESTAIKETSVWVQDTVQAGSRLTLSLGLRWEFSPAPLPQHQVYFLDLTTGTAFPEPWQLWPDRHRNFAPRAGAVLRLTRDGRTVLRAAAGLYYESSLSIATDVLNGGPLNVSAFDSPRGGIFSSQLTYGFMPGLRLPRVTQSSVTLERALGEGDVVSLGYVGSTGRDLLRREVGGLGSSPTFYLALTTNNGYSNYHAMEVQYRRRMARGLQAAAAYAWSHSIDNGSSDAFLNWAPAGSVDKGSSDFDLRQSFTGTMSYEFAPKPGGAVRRAVARWGIDAIFRARSGFPISVLNSDEYAGVTLVNAFRPDLNYGVPVWLADPASAGGRRLNAAAFYARPVSPASFPLQGTLGRNAIGGFGMSQVDMALRREFAAGERRRIQVRVEAFNLLNHPSFADPVHYLNSPMFGESTSMLNMMLGTGSPASGLSPMLQTGGARSIQGSIRLQF